MYDQDEQCILMLEDLLEHKNETLLDVDEARRLLLKHFSLLDSELISLSGSLGRVLADDVYADIDLPPFANSAMDGFAVRAVDLDGASHKKPVTLNVVADIPAGQPSDLQIDCRQAARIMTGAPVPNSADAVVPVELTNFNYRQPGLSAPDQVEVYSSVERGAHIRPAGGDLKKGTKVLKSGRRLQAQDLGMLSMFGIAEVPVHRRPRVAVFSTGDELLPVDKPLEPGKIHDANIYVLIALIRKYGGEPINLGIASDQELDVRVCLDRAKDSGADLILSTAGVSVGAFDYVRSVVAAQGRIEFWRVNMRPGKPLAFGYYGGIPFIGLPGNPVSAFVGFEVFVRPALLKMSGVKTLNRLSKKVRLLEEVSSDGRESYLRAIVVTQDGELFAKLSEHQGSGNLFSLVRANALLIMPSEVKSLRPGDFIDAWLFDDM